VKYWAYFKATTRILTPAVVEYKVWKRSPEGSNENKKKYEIKPAVHTSKFSNLA
jgi:hypothetical protein